jgi:sigma-B regulation protein RsbQ
MRYRYRTTGHERDLVFIYESVIVRLSSSPGVCGASIPMPLHTERPSATKTNNVVVLGRGSQPMLFAHGYGCDQTMWRLITPAFAEDYRVVLFDHVGAGRSDLSAYSSTKYNSLDAYADDILKLCAELDLEHVVFVGHSVSAMIGVLASIKEPHRFERLILIGPSACYINDDAYTGGFTSNDIKELLEFQDNNYLGWSSNLAPVIMGNPDRPELAQELTNSFCRTDPDIARQFAAVTFLSDNRSDLSRVTTPTLILQCQEDVIAPLIVGQYVHEHVLGSQFVVLNASGHCPHLSAPEDTIAAMKAFLAQ